MKSIKTEKTLNPLWIKRFPMVVITGPKPVVSLTLGQVRNSRLLPLPLGMLEWGEAPSPRFRLASSATGGASAPCPIDVNDALCHGDSST